MSPPSHRHSPAIRGLLAAIALWTAAPVPAAENRGDVLVADFEGDHYGEWTVTGDAFGRGPARGKLAGQMDVSGFQGRGLVSSFTGGDSATGTLTSPPFTIERPFLNFLIGGGGYTGETCLNLLVGDKVVRTATGPNVKPGGSERLDWASWDVSEFAGKTAKVQIVDRRTGGWGHINVDQIVQGDTRRGVEPAVLELVVGKRYLHLPVANDAPTRRLRLSVDGTTVREFDIKLAEGKPDFLVFCDLGAFQGKRLRLESNLPSGSKGLTGCVQADEVPDSAAIYREKDRPQFHFSSRRGWLNDPNGLVWHDGEYHLFYQHNPYGWDWGNMHWGHAVSPDLVHWKEVGEALTPREYGDWCFSGSAVVDRKNTSGFGKGGTPPLVLAYTSTGRGECIAYSNDRGRTWTEPSINPVVKHQGRDPRLLWHAPTKRWVMAVFDEGEGRKSIDLYSSPDLKSWTYQSRINGFYECPDLFELPVEGEPGQTLWVVSAADGEYLLGQFDGRVFTPTVPGKLRVWYGNFYAAQTFSDTPDGRRIQIGWAREVAFPGMPFNQQMTVPCELTLHKTTEGIRLLARPVAELASLRGKSHSWHDLTVKPGENPLAGLKGDLFEIRAEVEVGTSGTLTLNVRGVPLVYDGRQGRLTCGDQSAPLAAEEGVVRLHALVDRGSVEVFGNGGRVAISSAIHPPEGNRSLGLSTSGATTRVRSLQVDELKSSWP